RPDNRDVVASLQRGARPTLAGQQVCRTEFGLPAHLFAAGILVFENNERMWIHELQLDHRPGHGDGMIFVIAAREAMVRKKRSRKQQQGSGHPHKVKHFPHGYTPPIRPKEFLIFIWALSITSPENTHSC